MTSPPDVKYWLEIQNLSFDYEDQPVFLNASLTIAEGHRIVAFVGESGVGKSTLLSLIAGFHEPASGEIHIMGQPANSSSVCRPVVFQEHNLFPWSTVSENIEFGLRARGYSKTRRREKARQVSRQLNLEGKLGSYPKDLSGGMKQRVGLARALAIDPDCILMDEPFSAIDFKTKGQVIEYFLESITNSSTYAVLVTHDLYEAASMASCVVCLVDKGTFRIVEFPASAGIHSRPEDPVIKERVACIKRNLD